MYLSVCAFSFVLNFVVLSVTFNLRDSVLVLTVLLKRTCGMAAHLTIDDKEYSEAAES